MKARLLAVALAFTLVLVAPLVSHAQGADPISVIKSFEAALSAGNLEAAMAVVADDAILTDTHPAPGQPNPLKGKEAIRDQFKGAIQSKYHSEPSNFKVSGDKVMWFNKVMLVDPTLPPGFPLPIESNMEAIVQGGKIKSYTIDNTPEWTAKLEKALAAPQQPQAPQALPTTGSSNFAITASLSVLGALSILGGLALRLRHGRSRSA